jgi:hypothetical protein
MTTTPPEPSPEPTVVSNGDPGPESTTDPEPGHDHDPGKDRRDAITEVDDELDAQADGDGLAAEAGRGEETGLAEG